MKPDRPVNLHSLFLFCKHGLVCDSETKTGSKLWDVKKQGAKKKFRIYFVIQKQKRQPGLLSFWITMTLFFCTLLLFGPYFFPESQTDPCFQNKNSGCRLTGVLYMSFDKFLLAVESRDLSQADKSNIRVSSIPKLCDG